MGSLSGLLYVSYHTDQSKLEVLDLKHSGDSDSQGDELSIEPYSITGHLCGNPRYLAYLGVTGAFTIWDVATRKTVRSAMFGMCKARATPSSICDANLRRSVLSIYFQV